MARKSTTAIIHAADPVPAALQLLAQLAAAGTTPDRMARETDRLLREWREDLATFADRRSILRENLEDGVFSAEETRATLTGTTRQRSEVRR